MVHKGTWQRLLRWRHARAQALGARALVVLAVTLWGNSAQAQGSGTTRLPMLSYSCTTTSGHTITGDSPPPECRNRDVRELNPDGSLRRIIPAPLTSEQRKKRDEEEKISRLEEEKERAQVQKDRSLLETYGSVEEIDAARERTVQGRQELINRANLRITQYQRERKRLDNEAEFYAKRTLPPELQQAYEANDALTKQQEKTRADAEQEIERIKVRFAAERKRYVELEEAAAEAQRVRERREQEAEQSQQ